MKTTYILGAGASAQTVPVINKFKDKLIDVKNILINLQTNNNLNIDIQDNIKEFRISLIEPLIEICIANPTIDTYAFKLNSIGDYPKLRDFKLQLSAFLMINQILFGTDLRYDNFIASTIANPLVTTSDNLRILTWNYDIQFQISFLNFLNERYLKIVDELLNVMYENVGDTNNNKFKIYRLNGSCGIIKSPRRIYLLNQFNLRKNDLPHYCESLQISYNILIDFILNFKEFIKNSKINPSLTFAFENNSIIKNCKEDIKDTEVLVVIGYSFPNYNRQIDIEIIKSIQNLKIIYVQDHNGLQIKNKLSDILQNNLIEIKVVDNDDSGFYIPNEFFEDRIKSN